MSALLLKTRLSRSRNQIQASLKRSLVISNESLGFPKYQMQMATTSSSTIPIACLPKLRKLFWHVVYVSVCRPKEVDKYDVKCSFELLFRDLFKLNVPSTSENHDRLREQLKNISYNYIYSYNFSKEKNILSKGEWRALNDLRSDDSIITSRNQTREMALLLLAHLTILTKWNSCFLISPNSNHWHTIPLK